MYHQIEYGRGLNALSYGRNIFRDKCDLFATSGYPDDAKMQDYESIDIA